MNEGSAKNRIAMRRSGKRKSSSWSPYRRRSAWAFPCIYSGTSSRVVHTTGQGESRRYGTVRTMPISYQVWEARSRLYRSRFLKANSKYLFWSIILFQDLQDLHTSVQFFRRDFLGLFSRLLWDWKEHLKRCSFMLIFPVSKKSIKYFW